MDVKIRGVRRSDERSLGCFYQLCERSRIVNCEVGHDLAINGDASFVQACDKTAVAEIVLTTTGIDALNPQAADLALLCATVTERVLTGVQYLFVCRAVCA